MATSVRARRARQEAFRAFGKAAAAVSIILIAVVGVQMLQRNGADGDMYFGGISCTEVRKQVGDYMANRLPSDVSERITVHLAECPGCQKLLREMQQRPMGNAASRAGPHIALLDAGERDHSTPWDDPRFDRRIASSPGR